MNLPSKHSNTGRVLRAMYNAGPISAGAIRRKANFSTDTEITARIRELRDLYEFEIPPAERVQQPNGKAVYVYHLVSVSHSAGLELDAERKREIFAPFALEPMTHDTWHQPEKRIRNDVPFVCGGEL